MQIRLMTFLCLWQSAYQFTLLLFKMLEKTVLKREWTISKWE